LVTTATPTATATAAPTATPSPIATPTALGAVQPPAGLAPAPAAAAPPTGSGTSATGTASLPWVLLLAAGGVALVLAGFISLGPWLRRRTE
jgi:hypothetical protein